MPTSKKVPNERKVSTGVRLDPELRVKLEELAAARRWTVSSYVEWVLEQHVADMEAHPTKPPTSRTRS